MKHLLLALPLLLLAGCVEPEPPVVEDPIPTECGAPGFQGLIGQPEAVLRNMQFPIGTRIIRPGTAVTMDFRPDRLNIEIGTNGRVEKVGCY